MELREIISIFLIACNAIAYGADPKGHMQPIGSHMDLLPIETVYEAPDPADFFNNYILESKPVLMKGVANEFPSFKLWNNDTYLL